MRILFGVHGYKPAYRIGGPIYSVSALAEGLVHRGHKVVVFTSNSNLDQDLDVPTDHPVDVDGVEVWYFQRTAFLKERLPFLPYIAKSLGFLYAPRMRRELDRLVPSMDLVHTHMPFNYPSVAAARAAFRHRKPLFYHQRGVLDPERLKFRALKKRAYIELVERPILKRATSLIALTHAEEESYRRLGVSTPCRVIPNGIHLDTKNLGRSSGATLGIPERVPVMLFMGRIHPTKGADVLLDAFLAVSRAVPDAILVFAGPDEFLLEERFRATAQSHGLAERVLFTGMVSGTEKWALLARANLFCLPSVAEGFSIAVLEAMASGVPVLLSRGCHFPEVEACKAGQVVERTPAAFADAAINLLRNREQLSEMGRAARSLVEDRYAWDRVVDQMIQAYREGMERHRRQTMAQ